MLKFSSGTAVVTMAVVIGGVATPAATAAGGLTAGTTFSGARTVGSTVVGTTSLRLAGQATNVNVRMEIVNSGGRVVARKDVRKITLNGATRRYTQSFRASAAGTYRAQVAVYMADWKKLAYRASNTGSVAITAATPQIFRPGRTVKVLPLGDSLTYGLNGDGKTGGTGGYRARLWPLMNAQGWSYRTVGPVSDRAGNHAGFPGWRIRDLVNGVPGKSPSVRSMMRTYQPDVVLLLIGTNDFARNDDELHAANRENRMIDSIIRDRPNAHVFVAKMVDTWAPVPENPGVKNFNAGVAKHVNELAARGKHVYSVDMPKAVTKASDLGDGVHPKDATYGRMASIWFSSLKAANAPR